MQTIYYSSVRNRALEKLGAVRKGAWVSLVAPTQAELDAFAEQNGLNADLMADARDIYEAPRVEEDDGNIYIFTRYCNPGGTEVATEPLLIVYTPDNLITISRHNTPIYKRLLDQGKDILTTQKTKTMMLILAEVNRSYRLHLNRVSKQILRFRAELKKSDISNKEFVHIIELEEDLNEFLAALQPGATALSMLTSGRYVRLYEDDRDFIEDIQLDNAELIEFTRSRLSALRNIRQVHDAIATNNLNRTFKRLTSISIFLTIPTIMGGLWGMNVALPFADNPSGFWIVLLLAVFFTSMTVIIFNAKKWF
ncbi:hypothetical protein CR970_00725 [Candidatus Saccharibacteria bacterium]|nr:MAG: hypothetical protein CR970_00725 [Candidatus Saccharibacteria bacterium]